jgi:hypothetical protein
MTLAATVARRRNIPGHLVLWTQKISKNGGNNPFSKPGFSGKKIPQYNGRYQLWAQILEFLTRPNIHGVHWFDFKIVYINNKKA